MKDTDPFWRAVYIINPGCVSSWRNVRTFDEFYVHIFLCHLRVFLFFICHWFLRYHILLHQKQPPRKKEQRKMKRIKTHQDVSARKSSLHWAINYHLCNLMSWDTCKHPWNCYHHKVTLIKLLKKLKNITTCTNVPFYLCLNQVVSTPNYLIRFLWSFPSTMRS